MAGCCCGGLTRRELLRYALLGAGAWAAGPLDALAAPPTKAVGNTGSGGMAEAAGPLRALIQRYASQKDDPWTMMHGVRAFGKGFMLDEGPAVDYLCANFLKEQAVGGTRYLSMPGEAEGHANTLLKTFLEAGVSLDHPITAVGRRRTVGDLLMSAKKLFTFDPSLSVLDKSRDEIAWSIIAFSITTPPDQDVWKNAHGQEIRLREIVATGFSTVEKASTDYRSAMQKGIMPAWKDRIGNFTCGGTHLIYSLAVAVRYGHLGQEGRRSLARVLDLLIWRLKADPYLADRYFEMVAKTSVGDKSRPYRLDTRLKFLGHSMEVLNYVKTFGLFTPNAAQRAEIRVAAETLAGAILDVSRLEVGAISRENRRLYHLLVGDACHAYHGLEMARGVNQA